MYTTKQEGTIKNKQLEQNMENKSLTRHFSCVGVVSAAKCWLCQCEMVTNGMIWVMVVANVWMKGESMMDDNGDNEKASQFPHTLKRPKLRNGKKKQQ